MKLRTKTLSIICATLVVLIAVLYGVSRSIVLGGFQNVEKDLFEGFSRIEKSEAEKNAQRAVDAMLLQVEGLSLKAADWAQWDDTYRFIRDYNAAYRKSNLNDEALEALQLNHIALVDESGRLVFGRAFDLEKGEASALPESLRSRLAPGSALLAHEDTESVISGILLLPENPLMIVSRPILTSEAKGPMRGSLLFGRFLDDAEISRLAQVTHLTLKTHRLDGAPLPPDVEAARRQLTDKGTAVVTPLSETTIASYTALRDLTDTPAVMVRVDAPRDTYQQGLATQRAIRERGRVILLSLVVSIAGAGLVLGLVMVALLESSVLSRLTRLSRKALEIGASGDFSGRVELNGRDEMAALAGSLNGMLEALDASHRQIEARNAEMRLLMDTLPAGLLSLDENFRVNPEHSRSAERLLGSSEIVGRDYAEVLGLVGDRAQPGKDLVEFLDVLRQELIPEDSMAGLNPLEELSFGGTGDPGWVRLRYFNIKRGDGQPNHILAVLEDITTEKKLAADVAAREAENRRLRAIAEDPDLFRDFLSETNRILRDVQTLAGQVDDTDASRPLINEIFRGVHTVKGVSGSFGLQELSDLAGGLETSLEPLRSAATATADQIDDMRVTLGRLQAEFDAVVASSRKLLGDDFSLEGGGSLRVTIDSVRRHMTDIDALHEDAAAIKAAALDRLRQLLAIPARKGLARSIKIVPGLLQRLGKDAEFRFEGQETPLEYEIGSELNTPLVHLLRNAFDHGLESSEERLDAGKPEQGNVCLNVGRQNGTLVVTLEDDGRGMDPENLKVSAVRKGLLTPEEAGKLSAKEALALIFRPGFSTAAEVTDVSGRGVGMDAVLQAIRARLHGDIEVDSTPGVGTRVTISVPVDGPAPLH